MSCLPRNIVGTTFCRPARATLELLRRIPERKHFIPSMYLNTKIGLTTVLFFQ